MGFVEDDETIAREVQYCFLDLFTLTSPLVDDSISGLISRKLTDDMVQKLHARYSNEEVQALKYMNPMKASGPDGLTVQFLSTILALGKFSGT